jgi:hypothetical protein
MALSTRPSTRDKAKEGFWREKLKQFQESKKSQAEFCREQGLNANTFSCWKRIIPERDAQLRTSKRRNREEAATLDVFNRDAKDVPGFVRLAVSDCQSDGSPQKVATNEALLPISAVAAEVLDVSNGRRVRIFNGADQQTVAALLSALSSLR